MSEPTAPNLDYEEVMQRAAVNIRHFRDPRLIWIGPEPDTVLCPQCEGKGEVPGPDARNDCPLCWGCGLSERDDATKFLDECERAEARAE